MKFKLSIAAIVLVAVALPTLAQSQLPDYHAGSWAVAFWNYDLGRDYTILASGKVSVDDLSGKVNRIAFPSLSAFFADQEVKGWVVDSITPLVAGQVLYLAITFKRKSG